jgi:hypothetical protein
MQTAGKVRGYCQVVALGHADGRDLRMSLCWDTRMQRVVIPLSSCIALLKTRPLSAGRAARLLLDCLRCLDQATDRTAGR